MLAPRRLFAFRPTIWLWAAAALWLVAAVVHAASYFFLADDFALLGEARRFSPGTLHHVYRDDLFSVYRPSIFAVAVLMYPLAGFAHPWAWSTLTLAAHAGNAWLLRQLGRSLGLQRPAAASAALLFLASPWAMEAYLWLSGLFDVLAVTGVLVCLRAASRVDADATGRAAALAGVVGGCALAITSKENTFVLPLMAGAVATYRLWCAGLWRTRPSAVAGRVLITSVAGLAVVALYFALRSGIVAESSSYTVGDYAPRILSLEAVQTVAATTWALLAWPLGDVPTTSRPWIELAGRLPVAGIVLPLLLAGRAVRRPALFALLAILLLLAMAPTAFHRIDPETITPRRYLYLAGVPAALAIGAALGPLLRIRRWAPHVVTGLLACVLVGSVTAQISLWRRATSLSRCAIGNFGAASKPDGAPLVVHDSPRLLGFGPWVVTYYAYYAYYADSWTWGPVHVGDAYLHLVDDTPAVVSRHAPAAVPSEAHAIWMCGCFVGARCAP